ncbi:unnamed protein product [Schistocephalus solidus]|uniref:Phosphatase tensin-type domain-containing protein n=1 Tax=Schistocephalus solidus TaxID=70667 RepID=A0A183TRP4_SCHSO|nr:unnamed protein product [Schistocephalus solidus]
MSYPAESGLEAFGSRNSMEVAHAYLDKRHPNSYAVYNLSSRVYRSEHWFDGRVSYRPFEANRAPSLYSLLELCQNARLWLSQKPTNVCVIHCTDGRQLSAILVCCLLCFCNVFDTALQAIDFFTTKRGPVSLTAAQIRFVLQDFSTIHYVCTLITSQVWSPALLDYLTTTLSSSSVSPFRRSLPLIGSKSKRPEMGEAQVAGAAGVAPGCTTTPGSDPTEWECHKDHIKKEPLRPDSVRQSATPHKTHIGLTTRSELSRQLATFQATAFSGP